MEREFKIALTLLLALLAVSVLLLELLARIHFFSQEFLIGFTPFALLLTPYVLFSTTQCTASCSRWLGISFFKKLLFPGSILIIYTIFSAIYTTFNWGMFVRLAGWLLVPILIFSVIPAKPTRFYFWEFVVAFLLWLPLEFGQLPGFDIIFNRSVQIPALALAAPAFGIYLFSIVRGLPGLGFSFRWNVRDLAYAGTGLLVLTFVLLPAGVGSGFIKYTAPNTSFANAVQWLFGIYFLVALPEELLFRGIFQNLFSKALSKFPYWIPLAVASVVFGLSHWNNFNPTDWRYVLLASVAGAVYGWVYYRTGKTTVSAIVHCGVNLIWAICFGATGG